MDDLTESFLQGIPKGWAELLQRGKSSPLDIALLCSGHTPDKANKGVFIRHRIGSPWPKDPESTKRTIHIYECLTSNGFNYGNIYNDSDNTRLSHSNKDMLRFLIKTKNTKGIPKKVIEFIGRDSEDRQDSNDIDKHYSSNDADVLDNLESWQEFKAKTEKAIKLYPEWKSKQKKVQKTGNLQAWLVNEIKINDREACIIKRFLTEKFNM